MAQAEQMVALEPAVSTVLREQTVRVVLQVLQGLQEKKDYQVHQERMEAQEQVA